MSELSILSKNRPRTEWTEERTKVLKKLWGEGVAAQKIAQELGDISRCAVLGKVHRLGLVAHRPSRSKKITMPTYSFMDKSSISIDG